MGERREKKKIGKLKRAATCSIRDCCSKPPSQEKEITKSLFGQLMVKKLKQCETEDSRMHKVNEGVDGA